MGVQHPNSTSYVHPDEPNLLNLHKAMEYDEEGIPHVRVRLGADNITITGNVNLIDNVRVNNTEAQSIPVYIKGNVIAVNQNSSPWVISANSSVNSNTNPIYVNFTNANISLAASSATIGNVGINSGNNIIGNVRLEGNLSAITGNIAGVTGNIAGITSNVNVTQGTIPWQISKDTSANSNTNPIFVKGTSDTSFFAPTQSDAFGRLRVSNPYTLADHFNRYQDNALSSNAVTGAGSAGYDSNNAAVTLTVGTSSSDSVKRETNRVYAYQPGKSLLVLQTFTFASSKTNLTQRAGYFDEANGFYLERANNNVYFVKRSSVSGIMTETRIAQADWNVNTLASLNLDYSQIYWMDIEWLGVGSVRMGFVIDGQFVHCHTFHHANNITGTYTTTSCLPVRKEIFNTGITSGTSTMLSICTSVISEGGYSLTGRNFCLGHTLGVPVSLSNTPSTFTPIISLRLKSTRLGAIVLPTTFTITPVQQAIYKYQIYTKAVTSGGTWTSVGTDSSVEYNLNPSSITSGSIALSAFINATNQTSGAGETTQLPFQYQLERNSFTATCYEIVIGVGASTNNTTCYSSINWTEIT